MRQQQAMQVNIFMSSRHVAATKEVIEHLLQSAEGPTSIKHAASPYNMKLEDFIPVNSRPDQEDVRINMPIFDRSVPTACANILNSPNLKSYVQGKNYPLQLSAKLNTFIQNKLKEVAECLQKAEVQQIAKAHGREAELALKSAELICEQFAFLDANDPTVRAPQAFTNWIFSMLPEHAKVQVSKKNPSDPAKELMANSDVYTHRDLMWWTLLGMPSKESGMTFQNELTKHMWVTDDGTDFATRWLSKAVSDGCGYKSMGDVANMIYALMRILPPSDDELPKDPLYGIPRRSWHAVQTIQAFEASFLLNDNPDWEKIWLPTVLIHDGEADDAICIFILEYLHHIKYGEIKSLQRFALIKSNTALERLFQSLGHTVLKDDDCANEDAQLAFWGEKLRELNFVCHESTVEDSSFTRVLSETMARPRLGKTKSFAYEVSKNLEKVSRRSNRPDRVQKSKITDAFQMIDSRGDGVITKQELKSIFSHWSTEDLDEMHAAIDVNGDGIIDYSTFVDWVMGPPNVKYGWTGASHDTIKDVEENPQDAEFWNMLGFQGGGIVDGVVRTPGDCYIKAAELDPDFSIAWFNLANEGGGIVAGVQMSDAECYQRHMNIRKERKAKAAQVLQRAFRGNFKRPEWTFSFVTHLVRKRQHKWTGIYEEVAGTKSHLDKAAFTTCMKRLLPKYGPAQAHALWDGFVKGTGMEGVDFRGFANIIEAGLTAGQELAQYADMPYEEFEALSEEASRIG